MNRIILIGNGFDLAHGMATSYKNFLTDYWENTIKGIQNHRGHDPFQNEEIFIDDLPLMWPKNFSYSDLITSTEYGKIKYKNLFLKEITEKSYLQNWVDIENEYYSLLIKSFTTTHKSGQLYDISQLNADFNRIKDLLKKYLKKIEDVSSKSKNRILENKIGSKIYSNYNLRDFTEDFINEKVEIEYSRYKKAIDILKKGKEPSNYLDEEIKSIITYLGDSNQFKHLRKLLTSESAFHFYDLWPNQILFLSFNYTHTEILYEFKENFIDQYLKRKIETKFIHIHGTIDRYDKNQMIFGYGDELDDKYQSIEKLNDNRYLENIKSINYLETNNYKKLLEFLNAEKYQIFIMGHSCGISDRTLLNTLFENKNCVSIKPYYHKIKDSHDNYSDIVRNISRNFNNKVSMRNKVVNKLYCETLS